MKLYSAFLVKFVFFILSRISGLAESSAAMPLRATRTRSLNFASSLKALKSLSFETHYIDLSSSLCAKSFAKLAACSNDYAQSLHFFLKFISPILAKMKF